jgi:hypothetical protein
MTPPPASRTQSSGDVEAASELALMLMRKAR